MIFEVCCGSVDDVINAYKGKADRVELNSALYMGGLTPSIETYRLSRKYSDIKIICMIRCRGAGFNYNDIELETMFNDAKVFLEEGVDGLAFGFLNKDGSIDKYNTSKMIELIHSYNKEAVFHKAIDLSENIFESIDTLISLGIDRILTSGTKSNVSEGKDILKDINERYKDKVEILAGGGVNSENIKNIFEHTGIIQYHSSCKKYVIDDTTTNDNLSYSYNNVNGYEAVDLEKVVELNNIIRGLDNVKEN